jgi:poly-gamma-glutamate synthesis protein (capsule biosynthesis protein)
MDSVKIMFTGDVCFKVQHELDKTGALKILDEMLPIFKSADYRVMNLETPLAPEGVGTPIRKSGPNITGRPQNIGFLEAAGCNLAILANNHTGDYGKDALTYTLDLLDEHGISRVGAGENIEEAPNFAGGVNSNFIIGIGKLDKLLIIALDASKILNQGEEEKLKSVS